MRTYVIVAAGLLLFTAGPTNSNLLSNLACRLGINYGTVDPFSCPNFLITTLFSGVICGNLSSYPAEQQGQLCDSHCRCYHQTNYGQCISMNDVTRPNIRLLGDQLCGCFNSPVPQGFPSQQSCDSPTNKPFNDGLQQLGCRLQWNATYGVCTSDCVCSHSMNYGYCLSETDYCRCSNDPTVLTGNIWTQQNNGTGPVAQGYAGFMNYVAGEACK